MGLSWDVELLLGSSEWCGVGVGLGCGRIVSNVWLQTWCVGLSLGVKGLFLMLGTHSLLPNNPFTP